MNGRTPACIAIYLAIVAAGLGLDLWSKHRLFAELGAPGQFVAPDNPESIRWIWPGFFGLQTSLNEGALFGMGQGKVWVFVTLGGCATLAIAYWLFAAGAAAERMLLAALSGITGGILGNLYDRLGLWWTPDLASYPKHAVRDWILFRFQGWTWPNFNVADMLLVGGTGFLLLHAWLTPAEAAKPTPVEAKS